MYEKYIEGLKRNGLNVCTKIVFAFNAFHFLSLGEYQKVQNIFIDTTIMIFF